MRTLRGRFLRVRVELSGDGRASPEVAAVRAYASRFSYLNRYLPQMYRENRFGPDADQVIADVTSRATTPADFLERFLDNFEGILTPLEDRIAASYLLTDPVTTPDDALEWLGSWIGMSFDPAYPVERRRAMLIQAPDLYREHGTLQGLERALDIATGGGVSHGQIVVVEDFRLRRTFATILGADLADEDDPLLAGISASDNSFVGDTLFLGDENKKEFLALFGLDALRGQQEEQAVAALFDSLAHRVTVLVHEEVVPQDLGLIRRVVDAETPAHVQATVATASQPFIVGVASLVGVDSYLSPKPRPGPVRVGSSQIGLRDLILHPPSLDPRLEAGRYGHAFSGAAAPHGRGRPSCRGARRRQLHPGRERVACGAGPEDHHLRMDTAGMTRGDKNATLQSRCADRDQRAHHHGGDGPHRPAGGGPASLSTDRP